MTERPRTWTLHESKGGLLWYSSQAIDEPTQPVRVVEWDREKVVPIIHEALANAEVAEFGGWDDWRMAAEAVFVALNGNDET